MNSKSVINNDDEIKAYNLYKKYLTNGVNSPFGIDDVIRTFGDDYRIFFSNLIRYINRNIVRPNYALLFDKLIDIIIFNNNMDINAFLDSEGLTFEQLQSSLEDYLTFFRPDIKYTNEYLPQLHAVLQRYRDYRNKINEKEKALLDKKNHVNKLLMEFISIPYSLERFLLVKRIKTVEFRKYLDFAKQHMPEIYKVFEKNMLSKEETKNNNIQTEVFNILNLIKELGDDFTGIDLFKNTIYGPRELIKVADSILNKDDIKLFRKEVNKYNMPIFIASIISNSTTSELINTPLVFAIDGVAIETEQDKREMIVEDLKNNYIPITSGLFMDDYKKHYKENKFKSLKHS